MSDFTMFSGDTKLLAVTVTDDAGAPVDLTGATIRWQLAKSVNSAALVEKTDADGIEITSAESGEFTVTLDGSDTEGLRGAYYHEAEVTDEAGQVSTVLTGRVRIAPTLIEAAE